jgi:hypothetical protein
VLSSWFPLSRVIVRPLTYSITALNPKIVAVDDQGVPLSDGGNDFQALLLPSSVPVNGLHPFSYSHPSASFSYGSAYAILQNCLVLLTHDHSG